MNEHPEPEIPLTGGRTSLGVVRVGDTVRKPVTHNSAFVRRLLLHLAAVGFEGCPSYLGLDERGRDTFSFVAGHVPADLGEFSAAQLEAAARLLRALHDATSRSDLRGDCEVVCHGDASPCNFVFQTELPCALIDFDAAEPGDRWSDLGYAAWHWLDLGNDQLSAALQGRRLARFFADYGAPFLDDPIAVVLVAQVKVCSREVAPVGNKEWASDCLAWTRRHRAELRAGFEEAWKEFRAE